MNTPAPTPPPHPSNRAAAPWRWIALVGALCVAAFLIARVSGPKLLAERSAAPDRAVHADVDTGPSQPGTSAPSRAQLTVPATPADPAIAALMTRRIAGRIHGRVLGEQETPIAGARCELAPGSSPTGFDGAPRGDELARALTTAADGTFDFAAGEGPWRLTVAADGYGAWSADHLVAGDACDVRLSPELALETRARSIDGTPIADVELVLRADFRDPSSPAIRAARTDSSGRAGLRGLAPGTWYLWARHAEHVPHVKEVDLRAGSPAQSVELLLEPALGLTGRVVAPPAEPREGATEPSELAFDVRVESYSHGQSLVWTPTCDPEGRFATGPAFARGDVVRVIASAPGFAERSLGVRVDPPAPARDQTVEISLARGDARARGRAIDASGRPLEGVALRIASIAPIGRGADAISGALAAVTTHAERWRAAGNTGADGRFELDRLDAERQHVLALAASTRSTATVWLPPIDLGETFELGDVLLHAGASAFGYARDERGEPARGARLSAQREILVSEGELDRWRPTEWWRAHVALVRDDGAFRFDQLAAGSYELTSGGRSLGEFQVNAGAELGPLELVLPTASAPAATSIVEGHVVDERGAPIASAWLGAFAAPLAEAIGDETPLAITFSDARGAFKLRLPAADGEAGRATVGGVLRVIDVHGDHQQLDRPLADLAPGSPLWIELRARADDPQPLAGLVLSPYGEPLAGAEVTVSPPENRYCGCIHFERTTDAEGRFEFNRLADKDHRLRVIDRSGRFRPAEVVAVRPGGYVEVVLEE